MMNPFDGKGKVAKTKWGIREGIWRTSNPPRPRRPAAKPKTIALRPKKRDEDHNVEKRFSGYLPRVLKAQRHRPLRLGDQRKERVRLVLPHTLPRAVAVLHPAQHHARGGVRDCTKFRLKIAKFCLQIVENHLEFQSKMLPDSAAEPSVSSIT